MQELHRAPPLPLVKAMDLTGSQWCIAIICERLEWLELGQITSKEDLSWPVIRDHIRGHQCNETSLTDHSSRNVSAILGQEMLPPRWEANC
jgi:hypothetical protein